MAKTLNTANASTSSPNGTKKQRKKQAKREAKTMLKLEQARKDVEKAEQKVARAQAQLESSRTQLRSLEAELEKMHPSQHHSDSGTGTSTTVQPASTQAATEDHAYISPSTDEAASLAPVEDGTDALQDQATSSSSAMNNGNTSQEEETPAPTETEAAWHPVEAGEQGEQTVQAEETSHDDAEDSHVSTDQ